MREITTLNFIMTSKAALGLETKLTETLEDSDICETNGSGKHWMVESLWPVCRLQTRRSSFTWERLEMQNLELQHRPLESQSAF